MDTAQIFSADDFGNVEALIAFGVAYAEEYIDQHAPQPYVATETASYRQAAFAYLGTPVDQLSVPQFDALAWKVLQRRGITQIEPLQTAFRAASDHLRARRLEAEAARRVAA